MSTMEADIETQCLVIGAGPAGASAAAFLGQNGLSGIVISKAPATADTPRAHIFNPFAFGSTNILQNVRDIGLEEDGLNLSLRHHVFQSMRWCRSMVEEEYGRVRGCREHPASMGIASAISPCQYADLNQSQLEPLLVRYASHNNFDVRFSTELISIDSITNDNDKPEFICTICDLVTSHTYKIRTRYLLGADGARSQVARSLDFKFLGKPGGKKACNVLLQADLGHLLPEDRYSGLHWIIKPDRTTFPGLVAHFRVVRAWREWIMVGFGPGGENPFEGLTLESPELINCVRELIGDESVDVKILRLDPWTVRESVAEAYSQEHLNAFLLGDAAHRHPPAFGLGSNTCIQDAYNLAWKIAYATKGIAGPGLLASYHKERQPVGASLVHQANEGLRAQMNLWGTLGMNSVSEEDGKEQLAQLYEASPEGADRRAKVFESMDQIGKETRALGMAYNQWYTSEAIYLKDEPFERPELKGNPIVDVQVETYPGSRLPHVWLDVHTRLKKLSTHDLAGKGSFCILFGIAGNAWKEAAQSIAKRTSIPMTTYGIGYGLDYVDVDRDWHGKRGVEEDGCVLVRPDRFVAWRSVRMVPDCEAKLLEVLEYVPSRRELS